MFSTMHDGPLSLSNLLRYGSTVHGAATVHTWTETGAAQHRSFADLGARAGQLANALRDLHIGESDRVGTFMWNDSAHLEAYLAIPAMGAVVHPLNVRLPVGQLGYIADHAEDKAIIVDGSLVGLFAGVAPQLKTIRHLIVVNGDGAALDAPPGVTVHDYEDLLAAQSPDYDFPVIDERSAAAMSYTSGTTGDPKGVVYSHRSLYLHAMHVTTPSAFGLSTREKCLMTVPMYHVNSWSMPYAAVMAGASILMPGRFLQAEPLLAMMASERPTVASGVPAVWTNILHRLRTHPQDISHLKRVVVGGAAVPPALTQAYWDRHRIEITQGWGMTETSALSATADPPGYAPAANAVAYRATQGRMAPLLEFRLKNDAGKTVPHDGQSVGELQVRGPWVTRSYYWRAEDGPSPYTDHFDDGWLRTGDIGRITHDGYLTLVDRAKDVIKSGGEWISSVEMENDVMSHPDVVEAAVFAIPDEKWDERPCVAVVLTDDSLQDTIGRLRAHLAERWVKWQLPDHWAVVDEVPKTSVGKFDKKRLRKQYADGDLEVVQL